MNLSDFLNRRSHCPFCGSSLRCVFHSKRKQRWKLENNSRLIIFDLLKKNKQKEYAVGFSIEHETNNFCIEFYNKNVHLHDYVSISIINRFKEFYDNLGAFSFYMFCDNYDCQRYSCNSNQLNIDFNACKIDIPGIHSEFFGLFLQMENGTYKIYRLINNPSKEKSHIFYFKSNHQLDAVHDAIAHNANFLEVPLIDFVSESETTNRIKRLIIFS
jgi:hypothetical protein